MARGHLCVLNWIGFIEQENGFDGMWQIPASDRHRYSLMEASAAMKQTLKSLESTRSDTLTIIHLHC